MPALTSSAFSNNSTLPRTPDHSSSFSTQMNKSPNLPSNPMFRDNMNASPINTRLAPAQASVSSSTSAPATITASPGSPARRPQGGESTTVEYAIRMAGGDLMRALRSLVEERNSLVSTRARGCRSVANVEACQTGHPERTALEDGGETADGKDGTTRRPESSSETTQAARR